ncbi:hypothetical protein [Flavobacterium suzhouense]|uniref:Peptidase family M50 n=1 Tax=Flavobacterium suzhouense TaxID=1529638 RepID=A0ABW5NXK9_9FLAO
MKFITLSFNLKLFFYLAIAFILCTAIGTVSHEAGHCAAAKYYGRNPELHYAYMYPGEPSWSITLREAYKKDKDKIKSDIASPEKEAYFKLRENISKTYKQQRKTEDFFITFGGPLQTMLTGMLGFTILFLRRKKIFERSYLTLLEWFAVFLSYFWARQVFNFIFSIDQTFSGRKYFMADEPRLSQSLNLPPWAFGMVTCILGGAVLSWVTFKAIPLNQRLSFILSGIIGCAIGYIGWLDWLGPKLLP